MFTPQEIVERSEKLEKAVFGGYSVSSVEELLTPLQEDYAALYKENAVLKSKMKVRVEKLEEYREREDSIKKTLLKAQTAADEMVANAERRSAKMLTDSEQRLRLRSQELSQEVLAEQERVNRAKQATARFIVEIEERVQAQLVQLEKIKALDLTENGTVPEPESAPPSSAPEAKAESGSADISRIIAETDASAPQDSLGDTRIMPPLG